MHENKNIQDFSHVACYPLIGSNKNELVTRNCKKITKRKLSKFLFNYSQIEKINWKELLS